MSVFGDGTEKNLTYDEAAAILAEPGYDAYGRLRLYGIIADGESAGQAAEMPVAASGNPMEPRPAHFPARAKRVIHLFMNGGPSHVDTFDPKPALSKYAGQNLPMDYLATERKTGAALASPFRFRPRGESGIEVSELFEHVGRSIDEICVVRSTCPTTSRR